MITLMKRDTYAEFFRMNKPLALGFAKYNPYIKEVNDVTQYGGRLNPELAEKIYRSCKDSLMNDKKALYLQYRKYLENRKMESYYRNVCERYCMNYEYVSFILSMFREGFGLEK